MESYPERGAQRAEEKKGNSHRYAILCSDVRPHGSGPEMYDTKMSRHVSGFDEAVEFLSLGDGSTFLVGGLHLVQ